MYLLEVSCCREGSKCVHSQYGVSRHVQKSAHMQPFVMRQLQELQGMLQGPHCTRPTEMAARVRPVCPVLFSSITVLGQLLLHSDCFMLCSHVH